MEYERELALIRRLGDDLLQEEDYREFIRHGQVVSKLAALAAKNLGCEQAFCEEMALAGILHDIGKLMLAEQIYGKRGSIMRVEETKYVRMHPALANDVLRQEGCYSEELIACIANHHENYDGTGYPNHLEGEAIPYGARILRVCDVFAALVSRRPYRAAFSVDTATEMMIDEVKNFDMKIFLAFLSALHEEEFAEVRELIDQEESSDQI